MTSNAPPSGTHTGWRHLGTILSAAAVLLLVHLARTKDLLADFSRPTVLFSLHLLGIDATSHGDTIAVGRLEVPWTRDCAGLNLLFVLMALTIWVNSTESNRLRYWLKIASTLPAALLANVLRVLSLICYREALYPRVESPQLHYFLGLVWLLPFLVMVLPKSQRPLSHVMLEALQAAAAVALLAPMSGVPGSNAITTAALVSLTQCKIQTDAPRIRAWLTAGWMLAAIGIAFIGMESFWMPWLLTCPLLVSPRWIFSITGAALTFGSHPLSGMIPGGTAVVWLAAAAFGWRCFFPTGKATVATDLPAPQFRKRWILTPQMVSAFFILPFVASTIFAREKETFTPPAGTTFTSVSSDSYEVCIPGQPQTIGLIWFNPSGNGRHHSVQVCMKYRGVELEPSPECPDVYGDGHRWMREFFLLGRELVPDYRSYLQKTFRPRSSPGVHLIFVADSKLTNAVTFDQSCRELAAKLETMAAQTR